MARSGSKTNTAKGNALKKASLRANEQREEVYVEAEPLAGDGANRDIAGVILAIVAIASFIAVVTPATAPVTQAVAAFYHLGFGLGAYVLPLALLAASALVFLRDRAVVPARTCVGLVLIFVSVISMLSLAVPHTSLSTAGMFEPDVLASSGGYVGAFVASALQMSVGKTIGYVVLVGVLMLGFVILGFSISSLVRGASERAQEFVQRKHVDANETPWGDAAAAQRASQVATNRGGAAAASEPASASKLFDAAGAAETTFLGDRAKTTLLSGEPDDVDEDPFVDLSEQLAAERAQTTLIPVKERFVDAADEVEAMPPAPVSPIAPMTAVDVISDAAAKLADSPKSDEPSEHSVTAAEPSAASVATVVTPEGSKPIPDFLMAAGASGSHVPSAPSGPVEEVPSDMPAAKAASKPSLSAAASQGTTVSAGTDGERQLPSVSILRHNPASATSASSAKELEQTAAALQSTLGEFGLHSRVVGWISGPTVTTFKVQPGEGERVSRISNLEDDIALSLASTAVRIFAPIPGTSLVGIEIPNRTRQNVNLGDVLPYVTGGPLELAIGRDAEGAPIVADLAKMPHLLIAGTTGSGKSVMINSIVMSLLMRTFPEDVRLIMVDPKRVELAGYNGLPHLYVPVVTEPKQAASALQWAVSEMERRLKVFERIGVRKISTFNEKQAAGEFEHYDNPPAKMPYLVIIIDELSDLMMVAGKDVEASIVRIAQLGRAAGIHLIVATQRPSSNVVTGLIKANITNRIAFNVATGIDSRVIIDQTGAEKLTGYGDMLFSKVDWGKPKRIQGCFVSDDEINQVVEFVKSQGEADYHEEILSAVTPATVVGGASHEPSDDDPLIWEAAHIVVESQLGSTSGLQRRLKVGYARAGRIMDMLEEKGVVGPPDGSKPREVLLDEEGLAELESVEARMSMDTDLEGF